MKDCSHHDRKEVTPWTLFQGFVETPKGAEWLEKALADYKKSHERDAIQFIKNYNETTD